MYIGSLSFWISARLIINFSPINPQIFVGGLSQQTGAEELRVYFESFGEVKEAFIKVDPVTNRGRGFGFVTFAEPDAIDRSWLIPLMCFSTFDTVPFVQFLKAKMRFAKKKKNFVFYSNGTIQLFGIELSP